ncbi:expressed unknown protein [Seminavis robusta]|uniref:CRAL-TRIO domain-containing protein n=1 Tax=Seminavis robusta TaxID=568900 RepID=A0A9N8HCJ6_9STRA|nr:expressed unknown protein [Seminavis robusta]|eukprot:Sro220_g090760.1 n/a (333) ;mRNA; r:61853-62851
MMSLADSLLGTSVSSLFEGEEEEEEEDTTIHHYHKVHDDDEDTASESEQAHAEDEDVLGLSARFPSISQEERDAFRRHFHHNDDQCVKMLEERVLFRAMYEIDSPAFLQAQQDADDQADWEWASQTALEASKHNEELIPGLEGCGDHRYCHLESIPQSCFMCQTKDGSPALTKNGTPFVHVVPPLINLDSTTGASPEVHVTAIVLYLERKKLHIKNGFTCLIDCRQGRGWPNHNVFVILPSVQLIASAMDKLFPGQLQRLVVYPVPFALYYVFDRLKGWLPTSISETVELVHGVDSADAPPPTELSQFLDPECVDAMEQNRRARYLAKLVQV